MEVTYTITVRTGRKSGAGTDGEVTVALLAEGGDVGPFRLDKRFHNDFEAGAVDTYEVKGPDLGELCAVRVRNAKVAIEDDWLLEEIVVQVGGVTRNFPFYRWVRTDREVLIVEGSACLPQHVRSPRAASIRADNLVLRREAYRWGNADIAGLGQLDVSDGNPIPLDEQYRDLGARSYQVTFAETFGKIQLARPIIAAAWNVLDGLSELLSFGGVPSVSKRWRDDAEFARQTVQGVNPKALELVSAPPAGMPLTDHDVRGLLDPGIGLGTAFRSKRMFLVDFAILDGLPMFKEVVDGEQRQRYAPPCRALFYRGNDDVLRPVAIQLERDAAAPVFTPNDSPDDWLAAKIFVRCSEGNVHQVLAHAVCTHFTIEPFIIAIMRNVSAQHPLYKLMRRHFRYTLAINQGARKTLIAAGGVFDDFLSTGGPELGHLKLAGRAWEAWRLADQRLPDDLRRRGVDDRKVLPYYPYRDDAQPVWDAVGAYVRETLGAYFKSDADVEGDVEIQAFWTDLVTNGLPIAKLPFERLARVEDLCDLAQTLIFTVSVEHAAVNNLQFEHYAWVPNAPLGMHRPPPRAKGVTSHDEVRRMLPSLDQTIGQIAIGKALSTFGTDEEFLVQDGGWTRPYFREESALAAQRRFVDRLRAQVLQVENANRLRPVPYEILRADRIPCSVTI